MTTKTKTKAKGKVKSYAKTCVKFMKASEKAPDPEKVVERFQELMKPEDMEMLHQLLKGGGPEQEPETPPRLRRGSMPSNMMEPAKAAILGWKNRMMAAADSTAKEIRSVARQQLQQVKTTKANMRPAFKQILAHLLSASAEDVINLFCAREWKGPYFSKTPKDDARPPKETLSTFPASVGRAEGMANLVLRICGEAKPPLDLVAALKDTTSDHGLLKFCDLLEDLYDGQPTSMFGFLNRFHDMLATDSALAHAGIEVARLMFEMSPQHVVCPLVKESEKGLYWPAWWKKHKTRIGELSQEIPPPPPPTAAQDFFKLHRLTDEEQKEQTDFLAPYPELELESKSQDFSANRMVRIAPEPRPKTLRAVPATATFHGVKDGKKDGEQMND